MNTATLGKLYGTLEPLERLALIVAAGARGDEVEQNRLVDAAPRIRCLLPHHYLESQTLGRLVLAQNALKLGLALKAVLALEWVDAAGDGAEGEDADGEHADACLDAASAALAYRAYRDGWRLFCRDVGIDPVAFDELQIEGDALAVAEQLIDDAFPDDGAGESDVGEEDEEHSLPTTKVVARAWRERFFGKVG